jgi:putative transposase
MASIKTMASIHRDRKNIRLKGYDYSSPGGYFVTICTFKKRWLFGTIAHDEMQLSESGMAAKKCWEEIPEHFSNVLPDVFVVMPNHIHGIIAICETTMVGTRHAVSLQNCNTFGKPKRGSLSTIVGSYKSAVTKRIHELTNDKQTPIWQSKYYDRVIRNDKELENIRTYIYYNPAQWETDEENINQ